MPIESLFIDDLKIIQPDVGFRFGTDAVALAAFAGGKSTDVALDIGSGCGIIPILLAGQNGINKVYGVEILPDIAAQSVQSVALNNQQDKITIICDKIQNISAHLPKGCCTIVTANPPYRKLNSGKISPNAHKAIARSEQTLTIDEVITAADYLLGTGGKFCTINQIERLAEIITKTSNAKLEPKELKFIGKKLFILKCVKHAKVGLKIV